MLEKFKKLPLRKGVGIVLLNQNNEVFVAKRIDNPNNYWQMPQGGIDENEDYLDAATRELEEETSIKRNSFDILLQINPIEEIFSGTNNIRYKHIYYVAVAKDNVKDNFKIDKNNFNQVTEISTIKWHKFKEGFENIRNYNIEKRNVLEKVNRLLS